MIYLKIKKNNYIALTFAFYKTLCIVKSQRNKILMLIHKKTFSLFIIPAQ